MSSALYARPLIPDFIGSVLIIRALHAYLLIWPGVFRAPMREPFPLFFFTVAFIGRAYTVRTRAYIIRSIRYLMAVSVSDVYPTLRSSPPWPGREVSLSNLVFPARRSRAICATRARARVHAVYRSRTRSVPFFFPSVFFAPRAARSLRDPRSISMRDGEARTCFFSFRITDRSSC